MNFSIIDAIVLLFILLCGIIGFKEGIIKKLSTTIGLILVIVLAFMFKSKVSFYFYENLPFFNFWGVFKGIQTINIIFYEILAFILIASVLMIVYNLLLSITGLIQKVVNATIILNLPSKILGFIVGLIEGYIWAYVILFIITLPIFSIPGISDAKTANYILKETPMLSQYTEKTLDIYNDVHTIVKERKDKTNKEINEESLDLMLNYKIITIESAEKLINKSKIEINDSSFLEKYK